MRESKRVAQSPQPGELIAGRFRLIERLSWERGAGIFRAYQEDRDRFVALRLWRQGARDGERVARFRLLALRLSQRTDPHTIRVLDYGEAGDHLLYLAMELLEGQTLAERLQAGPLPPAEAQEVLRQIALGLREAHAQELPHGDLHPAHIYLERAATLDEPPRVKVLDFGLDQLARDAALDPEAEPPLHLPLYRAPEQLLGEEETPASDIYALGHLLATMLTGQAPLEGGDLMGVIQGHLDGREASLPPALERHLLAVVVRRAAARHPIERFPTAQALLDFLQSVPQEAPGASWEASELALEVAALAFHTPGLLSLSRLEARRPERAAELCWLGGHLNAVAAGEGARLLLLTGRTGWGKTFVLRAFCEELRRVAAGEGAPLFLLERPPGQARVVGGLWMDLERLLGIEAGDSSSLSRHVRRALHDISSVHEVHVQTILRLLRHDPELRTAFSELRDRRGELFDALRKPFLSLARRRVLVWCLEDLHHAEPLLLHFLVDLLHHLRPDLRLLIVGTLDLEEISRGSVGAQALNVLQRAPSSLVVRRRVGGLELDGVEHLLRDLLGAPVTRRLAQHLRLHTGGQPRFLREAARHLAASGAIHLSHEGVFDASDAAPLPLPVRLEELLLQRLYGPRGEETQLLKVLEALALLGEEVPEELPLRLGGPFGPEERQALLREGVKADLLRCEAGLLRFSVPALQRALYEEQLRRARVGGALGLAAQRVAEEAASLLDRHAPELGGPTLRRAAQLWSVAGHPRQAAEVHLRAAENDYRTFQMESALEHYLEAWQVLQALPPQALPPSQPALALLRIGELYGALGESAVAEDFLRRAREAAQAWRTPDALSLEARAAHLQSELALQRDDRPRAATLLQEARALYHHAGDEGGLTRATIDRAWLDALDGERGDALERLLEAQVLSEVLGSDALQARAALILARVRLRQGELGLALRDVRKAMTLYSALGEIHGHAVAGFVLGKTLLLHMRPAEAREALLGALDAFLRVGDHPGTRAARLVLAAACAAEGDLIAARRELEHHPTAPELRLAWIDLLAYGALMRLRRREQAQAAAALAAAEQHYEALERRLSDEDASRVGAKRAILLGLAGEQAEALALLAQQPPSPWTALLQGWLQGHLPPAPDAPSVRLALLRSAAAVDLAPAEARRDLLQEGARLALSVGLAHRAFAFRFALEQPPDNNPLGHRLPLLIGW